MQIGLTLPTMISGLTRDAALAWARRIDAGPFSTLAAGERITFPNHEMLVSLAAAAAVTERVRLAFTLVVLPMHPTLLMAKQIATLDVLSAGRVTVGVGVGGREEDYRALGAPWEGRARRMAAQVALLRRAWAGETVVEGAPPLGPVPLQPGGPPVWAGVVTPDGIRRAARWADGICGFDFGPDPAVVGAAFDIARTAWREAGRGAPRLVTSCWYALGPDGPAQMDAYVRRYMGFAGADVAAMLAERCTTTSAAALRDVIARLADAGTDELLLVPTTADPDEVHRVADLIGGGV